MINVVGSGIAGSLVTHVLRGAGHEVRVFDDNDQFSGSRASSNLYIASWLKKYNAEARRGIEVLEGLFKDKIDQPFSKGIADAAKVRHLSGKHLFVQPDVTKSVISVSGGPKPGVQTLGESYAGPVVLCTGHRSVEVRDRGMGVCPLPTTDVLVGHCLLIEGELEEGQSSLTLPLPYKHHKLYQYEPGIIYFANSTTLKRESFQKRGKELYFKLLEDATKALGWQPKRYTYRVGYRPVMPGYDFGALHQITENVWHVNGGGKNGLVAYANLAAQLAEKLK